MYKFMFEVTGQQIKRIDDLEPVAMCRNLYTAHFDFKTDEWVGIKTAVFVQGRFRKNVILDENNECNVPWEFFYSNEKTYGYVSVFCGDLVTARQAIVIIKKSGYYYDDAYTEPTPDIYQQLITILQNKGDKLKIDESDLLLLSGDIELSRVSLSSTAGKDGREIELQNNGSAIQWRYVGDQDWTDLVQISELKGDKGDRGDSGSNGEDGREVELQKSDTSIQWRYVGEDTWKDLVPLSDIKGNDGADGERGAPGQDGKTPTIGENGNWYIGDTDTGKPSRGKSGVELSDQEPTDKEVNVWINESSEQSFELPEIKDEEISQEDTWSSQKIRNEIDGKGYTIPVMTDSTIGGGKAVSKTDETVPVAIDSETGQLFVPDQSMEYKGINQVKHSSSETTIELSPNVLHIWSEVLSLDITLAAGDPEVVNEYMFSFVSGSTPTQITLPSTVKGLPTIEANSVYDMSIVNNKLAYGRWDYNVSV